MKVALCSDFFYPMVGGVQTHIEGLARILEKRGHEVTIITKDAEFNDKVLGLKVVRVKTLLKTSHTLDLPVPEKLREILEKGKFDVVHAHHAFSPLSLYSLLFAKELGIKTVLTTHSIQFFYEYEMFWKPISYFLFPYKIYINNADRIIAISKSAKSFISYFTNKKVDIIPSGIDVEKFSPKKKTFDGKTVLFVGRLVYRKGLHLLLSAMLHVLKERKDAKLLIVGDGYLKSFFEILIQALDLKKNVEIKSGLIRDDVIKLYQNSHLFVLPSIFGESFGVVLLEAMASKTPIIASKQGGIKEIIKHGKNGFLVERGNVKELARMILWLLENEKLSRKISSKAYKYVKQYDWEKIVKRIERVYKS